MTIKDVFKELASGNHIVSNFWRLAHGWTIAIDNSMLLHNLGASDPVSFLVTRDYARIVDRVRVVVETFLRHGITPLPVLDNHSEGGRYRPKGVVDSGRKEKRQQHLNAAMQLSEDDPSYLKNLRSAVAIPLELEQLEKEMLDSLSYPYTQSLFEADGQAALHDAERIIDALWAEDGDFVGLGVRRIIREIDWRKGSAVIFSLYTIDASRLRAEATQFERFVASLASESRPRVVKLWGLVRGCDYSTWRHIGLVAAREVICEALDNVDSRAALAADKLDPCYTKMSSAIVGYYNRIKMSHVPLSQLWRPFEDTTIRVALAHMLPLTKEAFVNAALVAGNAAFELAPGVSLLQHAVLTCSRKAVPAFLQPYLGYTLADLNKEVFPVIPEAPPPRQPWEVLTTYAKHGYKYLDFSVPGMFPHAHYAYLLFKGRGSISACTVEVLKYYLEVRQIQVPSLKDDILKAISLQHRKETFTLTALPLCVAPDLAESHQARLLRHGADPATTRLLDRTIQFPVMPQAVMQRWIYLQSSAKTEQSNFFKSEARFCTGTSASIAACGVAGSQTADRLATEADGTTWHDFELNLPYFDKNFGSINIGSVMEAVHRIDHEATKVLARSEVEVRRSRTVRMLWRRSACSLGSRYSSQWLRCVVISSYHGAVYCVEMEVEMFHPDRQGLPSGWPSECIFQRILHVKCDPECVAGRSGACWHMCVPLLYLCNLPRRHAPLFASPTAQHCKWNEPAAKYRLMPLSVNLLASYSHQRIRTRDGGRPNSERQWFSQPELLAVGGRSAVDLRGAASRGNKGDGPDWIAARERVFDLTRAANNNVPTQLAMLHWTAEQSLAHYAMVTEKRTEALEGTKRRRMSAMAIAREHAGQVPVVNLPPPAAVVDVPREPVLESEAGEGLGQAHAAGGDVMHGLHALGQAAVDACQFAIVPPKSLSKNVWCQNHVDYAMPLTLRDPSARDPQRPFLCAICGYRDAAHFDEHGKCRNRDVRTCRDVSGAKVLWWPIWSQLFNVPAAGHSFSDANPQRRKRSRHG